MTRNDDLAVLLREKWSAGFLPGINGIGWPTSDVDNVSVEYELEGGRHKLERGEAVRGTLADFAEKGQIHWQHAGQSCESFDQKRGLKAIGGEGAWGSEGFVAVSSTRTGELVWYAFFESSNPFEQVRFEGDALVATTNLGDEWRFPLDSPASFTIKHP